MNAKKKISSLFACVNTILQSFKMAFLVDIPAQKVWFLNYGCAKYFMFKKSSSTPPHSIWETIGNCINNLKVVVMLCWLLAIRGIFQACGGFHIKRNTLSSLCADRLNTPNLIHAWFHVKNNLHQKVHKFCQKMTKAANCHFFLLVYNRVQYFIKIPYYIL